MLVAVISKPPTVPFVLFWYCAERSSWLISKTEFAPISSVKVVDVTLIVSSEAPWLDETVKGKISPPIEFTKLKVSPVLNTAEPIVSIGILVKEFCCFAVIKVIVPEYDSSAWKIIESEPKHNKVIE